MTMIRTGILILAALAGPASAQPSSVARGMTDRVVTPAERFAQTLREIGMTVCAPAAQRAAGFVFEDGEINFVVQPLGPDVNRWPTVVTIEGAHASNGRTRFTTLTVTPLGNGCAGSYQQVIHWTQPCAELKRTVFAGFAGQKPLLRNVQISELGPAVQLYLLPAGTGCTSVKKELFR